MIIICLTKWEILIMSKCLIYCLSLKNNFKKILFQIKMNFLNLIKYKNNKIIKIINQTLNNYYLNNLIQLKIIIIFTQYLNNCLKKILIILMKKITILSILKKFIIKIIILNKKKQNNKINCKKMLKHSHIILKIKLKYKSDNQKRIIFLKRLYNRMFCKI